MLKRIARSYSASFSGIPKPIYWLALAALVNRAGTMVVPFLALYLTEKRGYTPFEAGTMLTVYGLGGIGGAFLGGWLCDRLGPIRVQVASLFLGAAGFLVLGALESRIAIAVALLLLATVNEAMRPANGAATAELSTGATASRAFALNRLAVNLGMTIGPAVGGVLAVYSYRWLFALDAATNCASGILLWLSLGRARLALPRRATAAERSRTRARSPWRDRIFLAAMGLAFLQALIFFQLSSTFMLYLRNVDGLPEPIIGLVLGVNTVLIVLFEMVIVHRLERFDKLRVLAAGGALIGCGFGLLPFGASLAYVALTVLVWTAGEMLSMPFLGSFVAERAGEGNRGGYMGLFTAAFAIAFGVAPAAGTFVYERLGSGTVWYGCAILGVLVAIGFIGLSSAVARARSAPGDLRTTSFPIESRVR